MKTYKSYLEESKRQYEFQVRIAGLVESENLKTIKNALAMFKAEKVSQLKRLPIQEHSDFPSHGPIEVTILEVATDYPATPEQVRAAVFGSGCCAAQSVKVIGKNNPYIAIEDGLEQSNIGNEPVLETEELKAAEVSEEYKLGGNTDNLIKELLAARSYEYPKSEGK